MTAPRSSLEISVGSLIWLGVLWDGFATIVLPRTVAPMRRCRAGSTGGAGGSGRRWDGGSSRRNCV